MSTAQLQAGAEDSIRAESDGWHGQHDGENHDRARPSADGDYATDDDATEARKRDVHGSDQSKAGAAFSICQLIDCPRLHRRTPPHPETDEYDRSHDRYERGARKENKIAGDTDEEGRNCHGVMPETIGEPPCGRLCDGNDDEVQGEQDPCEFQRKPLILSEDVR